MDEGWFESKPFGVGVANWRRKRFGFWEEMWVQCRQREGRFWVLKDAAESWDEGDGGFLIFYTRDGLWDFYPPCRGKMTEETLRCWVQNTERERGFGFEKRERRLLRFFLRAIERGVVSWDKWLMGAGFWFWQRGVAWMDICRLTHVGSDEWKDEESRLALGSRPSGQRSVFETK